MRGLLISIFLILTFMEIEAQQAAIQNMYYYNWNYVNPAFTGIHDCTVFNLTDKNQWVGIKNAPSIQVMSAQWNKPVSKTKKYGFGLNLVHDVNGASKKYGGEFLYSFHITLGNIVQHHLSFGLSANLNQLIFDETDFTQYINDPIITRGKEMEIGYNAATGIYLYNEFYFIGISVYNLLPINTSLYQEYGNDRFLATAIAGYNFVPNSKIFLLRTSFYGCKGEHSFQADLNNHIFFQNNLWTGLTLRKYFGDFATAGQNAIVFIGYNLGRWTFSYACDIGINTLQLNHFGSHQVSLCYKICRDKYACPVY